MQIFYAPQIEGDEYRLPEDESKHCIRVLRMQQGDELYLTDGCGNLHTARIADENPKRCLVQIVSTQHEYGKRPFNLHIAIAPTKNIERFEWFLEKATEIGVDTITPLLCERSERKDIKVERLQKIVISAMKQSVKAYLPIINSIQPLRNFVKYTHQADLKAIAHCNSWDLTPFQQVIHRGRSVLVLIGPEGDFTPTEVNLALNSGFTGVSLSTSRLRTETAGVVACHTANLINGV
ncbi:MAG TPA: 16S rRNA (uracil(1498)-N(3))-methyltransferase [Tenuifilum sp.]|uniref:16S rRNA (uracil(1498)-N(3))-methyltransferase n=2 Tax=Tenuifilum sp. TaxID=2760880 RepID=UPI002D158D98|nr:16S rRNA (uracil(1498)-N(3))-methyltransferase [Tenuifilum sp.]HOK85729.1 16S rRNA (uracil(1498)-N(3))-methyltransferase [Tenuifilum sp.]HQI89025.1 16S rRNA (uracil(1498)-N(3))-methyltransferase [Tenuifilum sp.]